MWDRYRIFPVECANPIPAGSRCLQLAVNIGSSSGNEVYAEAALMS